MATLESDGWHVSEIPAPLRSLAASTWANLPSAASYPGVVVRVSDVGVAPGILVISDGARWVPMGPQVLARSAVAALGAADTNENALATITVPAGAMGLNGSLRITTLWSFTNNANGKSVRIRLGGIGGTSYVASAVANTASLFSIVQISNRNSAGSQVGNSSNGYTGLFSGANNVSAIDTSQATTVVATVQKTVGGDGMTLESYLVELLP